MESTYAPTIDLTNLTGSVTTLDGRLKLVEGSYAASTTVSTLQTLTGAVNTRLQLVESSYAAGTDLTPLSSRLSLVETTVTPLTTAVNTQASTLLGLGSRVTTLEGNTYRALRTVATWLALDTDGSAGEARSLATTIDSAWINKFNFYCPTGYEATNATPGANPNTTLTVAVLPEGSEIEIFNGSAYAVTLAAAGANSTGPDSTNTGTRTYTLATQLLGTGTSLASKGAAVVKQVRSTSIATASLATPAPLSLSLARGPDPEGAHQFGAATDGGGRAPRAAPPGPGTTRRVRTQ